MTRSSTLDTGVCDGDHNDYDGYGESIRKRVFRELDKNPRLTPSDLRSILGLHGRVSLQVLANYKTQWLHNHRIERGSKCSIHAWRGWCHVPLSLRGRALDVGWLRSRARNRWFLWRDRLGRLEWFETGRVNVYVRRPASVGRAYQLICNGLSFTGLITDMKVLEKVLSTVRFKGAHYVFPVGQRLPKLTINLFQKSNGVIIKVGDVSHPDSLEVIAVYPDWAERNERLFDRLTDVLKRLFEPSVLEVKKDVEYVI